MTTDALSGLAGSIRAATDAETFDLSGKNSATIERAVADAFAQPFALAETIRLTFVTGAGKLARQKYDENAAKAVTGPLKELGYQDDAGGGPGTYKLQHDTGKNLKTVVVYPKVQGGGTTNSVDSSGMSKLAISGESLVPEGTPQHKIAFASNATFERMVVAMCPSWSQKKGCLNAIEDLVAIIQGLDQKLMTGTPLSDTEQECYDSISVQSLTEKGTKVKDLMHGQVEKGELTTSEKSFLVQQVTDRIANLEKELAESEKANKVKRVETLKKNLEKAQERKEKLTNVSPRSPYPLKHNGQIAKLRQELAPLLQLEATAKGRLLSLKESQSIARKEQIEAEIVELELSSRGWFETDEDFDTRVQASRIATKPATSAKKTAKPAAPSGGRTTTWVTPGASAWGAKKKTGSKPTSAKSKPKGSGVFAAMMMDSDSDSD